MDYVKIDLAPSDSGAGQSAKGENINQYPEYVSIQVKINWKMSSVVSLPVSVYGFEGWCYIGDSVSLSAVEYWTSGSS
jgi:hypothetical protein